jgi:hypothetical protein
LAPDTKIIFVADFYIDDYHGGAELTSDAILQKCPYPYRSFYSSNLTKEDIDVNKESFWVFGNACGVKDNVLLHAAKNLNYCVLEYDYKYCKYRSPKKHIFFEKECRCQEQHRGKITSVFFSRANSLWFMSEKQKDHYEEIFPFLKEQNSFVLSSVFDDKTLDMLKNVKVEKNNKWLIVSSDSWIKGTQAAVEYANQNKFEYFLAENLPYKEMLLALAGSKGLIFLPPGRDTCPRLVIEAKLLDCELIINENVQHTTEKWLADKQTMFEYLASRPCFFWNEIKESLANA